MKFNWGTGIAIFYSLFVIALVSLVWQTRQYDHSLVSDRYYADDLKYQEHYDKLTNSRDLPIDLSVQYLVQMQEVKLNFPEGMGSYGGKIHFFCPSDSKQDFYVPIKVGEGIDQRISTKGLKGGLWKVKVDWTASGKAFFKEEIINI